MNLTKIMVVIALVCVGGLAQKQPVKTVPLTDSEAKEIQAAIREINSFNTELQQRIKEVLSVRLDDIPAVVAAVGKAQLAEQKMGTANERAERIRDKHRSAHACTECSYSADFASLTPKE